MTFIQIASALIAGLLLATVRPVSAEGARAVEAVNGSAAADWRYGDGSYSTIQSYGISGAINVPIWGFVGASASASTYRTRTSQDFSGLGLGLGGPFVESRGDSTLGGALFARTPTLGRLEVNYREAVESKQFAYAGELQAYLSRWTLAAGILRAGVKGLDFPIGSGRIASNSYRVGASFYPADEIRLDARVDVLERDVGRLYAVGIEWLPSIAGLPISARFDYSRVAGDITFPTVNNYGVSITYFFAPSVSLFTLDRAFR